MTLPVALTPAPVDPSMVNGPNADHPEMAASPHATDPAVPTQFGAVLTLLLAHADPNQGVVEDPPPSVLTPLEVAADAAIDDATHDSLIAALAAPITVTSLSLELPPDATATTDTKATRPDLDVLAPEFRDRLERVIERMESEFGYKVEVTETYRSQDRQNALFAQGRTEPGQVVTWTRASNHTIGRAADLIIDGSYDTPEAYARLARIAREEGLRTLGPRDAGHVELPSSSRVASARSAAEDAPPAPDRRATIVARPAPSVASQSSIVPSARELESPAAPTREATAAPIVARVASVAQVAQVATVAQVAQVATVGAQATPTVHSATRIRSDAPSRQPAASRRADAGESPAKTSAEGLSPIPGLPLSAPVSDQTSDTSSHDPNRSAPNDERRPRTPIDASAARDGAAELLRQTRDELMRAVTGADPAATTSTSANSREAATTGIGHADMSERIARLLKVQDAASERPLSQVMLRLERPDGGEDRLRVDLRGNAVSATLDVGDQAAADRLSANVKELQRSLERHGFETDSLTVRTATRSMESSTLSRAVGASVESDLQRTVGTSSTSNMNTSSRERGARQDEQRQSSDSQRQRSRREQKGGGGSS